MRFKDWLNEELASTALGGPSATPNPSKDVSILNQTVGKIGKLPQARRLATMATKTNDPQRTKLTAFKLAQDGMRNMTQLPPAINSANVAGGLLKTFTGGQIQGISSPIPGFKP